MTEQHQSALITGAGSGIGRCVALRLASKGWRVTLVGRTESRLQRVAAEIADTPGQASVHAADVSDPAQARAAVRAAIETFDGLSALINNAGDAKLVNIADHDAAEIERIFAVNALGPINLIAAALPELRRADPGVVVNVSSVAAHDPFPGLGVYGAAKAATEGIVRAIRNEEPSVRAYAIAPGAVETPLLRTLIPQSDLPSAQTLDPDDVAAEIVACITGETDLEPGGTRVLSSPS
ncbi:MAG: SDR family NAD(P)-dependent oxidoreductase [Phycisphaerales bacterium]